MYTLDIVLIILIIIFFFFGVRNGFIKELGKIVGVVLGIYIAMNFTGIVIEWIGLKGEYQYEIAFFITLVAVIIGVNILSRILTKFIDVVNLSSLNRLLGGVLSSITVILILSIVLELLYSFNLKSDIIDKSFFNDSFMYGIMNKIADVIFPFIGEYIAMSKEFLNDLTN